MYNCIIYIYITYIYIYDIYTHTDTLVASVSSWTERKGERAYQRNRWTENSGPLARCNFVSNGDTAISCPPNSFNFRPPTFFLEMFFSFLFGKVVNFTTFPKWFGFLPQVETLFPSFWQSSPPWQARASAVHRWPALPARMEETCQASWGKQLDWMDLFGKPQQKNSVASCECFFLFFRKSSEVNHHWTTIKWPFEANSFSPSNDSGCIFGWAMRWRNISPKRGPCRVIFKEMPLIEIWPWVKTSEAKGQQNRSYLVLLIITGPFGPIILNHSHMHKFTKWWLGIHARNPPKMPSRLITLVFLKGHVSGQKMTGLASPQVAEASGNLCIQDLIADMCRALLHCAFFLLRFMWPPLLHQHFVASFWIHFERNFEKHVVHFGWPRFAKTNFLFEVGFLRAWGMLWDPWKKDRKDKQKTTLPLPPQSTTYLFQHQVPCKGHHG